MASISNPAGYPNPSFPGINDAILQPELYLPYSDLEAYINEVNAPDNRSGLVSTFGNQSITGFLSAVGAVNHAGIADEVTWWEDTRLHKRQDVTIGTAGIASSATSAVLPIATGTATTAQKRVARIYDILLINGEIRAMVTATTATSVTVAPLSGTFGEAVTAGVKNLPIVGNYYPQGSDAPTEFLESNVVKRTNPFIIVKDMFRASGSQLTNISWITLPDGSRRWTTKGEIDTRKRFLNNREMGMVLGQSVNNGAITGVAGTEGLFSAVEDRGINVTGYIETLADVDLVTAQLVKQGAGMNYILGHNLSQGNKLSNLMGAGLTPTASITAGALEQFGKKGAGMSFDYKGFQRGGYNFSQLHWSLLDDPTLLGDSNFAYVAVPLTSVVDPKTGTRSASLEMNFKKLEGVDREMVHGVRGLMAGGASNTGRDEMVFDYLSECNLVVRAANQFVLGKKA